MPKKFDLDFSKISFNINWASGSIIVTLLITVITLYTTNKGLQSKVDDLQKSNTTLTSTVNTLSATVNVLKGSQEITNSAISAFMQNPTSELKYRLEQLEQIVQQRLGVNLNTTPQKPFTNIAPPVK